MQIQKLYVRILINQIDDKWKKKKIRKKLDLQ